VFLDAARGADAATAGELGRRLADYNARNTGSSQRVERIVVLAGAPDADAFEITDKGYLSQRAVLARRCTQVERLYVEGAPSVLLPEHHP
jgi:feruloyl-CoA synthase